MEQDSIAKLMVVYTRKFGTGNRSKNSNGMIGRMEMFAYFNTFHICNQILIRVCQDPKNVSLTIYVYNTTYVLSRTLISRD